MKTHNSLCNTHLLPLHSKDDQISNAEKSKRNLYNACNYLVSKITEVYNKRIQQIGSLNYILEKEIEIKTTHLDLCIEKISQIFNCEPGFSNLNMEIIESIDVRVSQELRRSSTLKTLIEKGDLIFEGHWEDYKLNGFGKVTTERGDVYVGDVVDGVFEGNGLIIYSKGQKYEGQFKNGKRDGLGKNTWPNGDIFEGEFKEGKINGKGKFYYKNGDYFEGLYSNDKKQGQGIYVYSDGNSDEGNWEDNKLQGLVIRRFRDRVITAAFKDGKLLKIETVNKLQ